MKKFYLLTMLLSFSLLTIQAQLTDVITGLNFPYGVALDGNDLYVAEATSNRIIKLDITDPVPPMTEVVLENASTPLGLLIDDNLLYYSEQTSNRVSRIDLSDANPSPTVILDVGLNVPSGLLIDGDFLYISSIQTGEVVRVDLTQTPFIGEVIASGITFPQSLVKFGDALYVSEFGNGGSIRKIDISQTPAVMTTLTTDVNQPAGLTLNGSFLYVAFQNQVARIDLNAATPTVEQVTDQLDNARSVAFNGLDMYIGQVGPNQDPGEGKISKLAIGAPVFSELANICLGDTPNMLGGASPSGGAYSGTGVTDNGDGETFTFDSDAAGLGVTIVTYTISAASATANIEVVAPPSVTFTALGPFSLDDGVQALSGGSPMGGTYSGPGVTDNMFDPAAVGVGAHEITYTYTNPNGCDGSATAMITVNGGPGEALDFDGVDDVATAALGAGNLNAVTISGWVYPTNAGAGDPDFDGFFGWRNNTDADFYMLQLSATQVEARFRNSAGVNFDITDDNLELNTWQHYTLTYDGTTMTLYRNGEEVGSRAADGSMSGDGTFRMGMLPFNTDEYYLDGRLDDVRVFTRSISCFEALQTYSCELMGDEQNLVAYYTFNQGAAGGDNTGTTEVTATTGPNATLNNFALMGDEGNFVTPGGTTTGIVCGPVMVSTITLTGNGILIMNGDDSPAADDGTDLGNVNLGTTGTSTFQINVGADGVPDIASVSSSNPFFSGSFDEEGNITITFSPSAGNLGQQNTTITISIDGCSDASEYTFDMTANATNIMTGGCPEGDITFNSQAEVDAFVAAYPNCTRIFGNLRVGSGAGSTDINDISGLSNLATIDGLLAIFYNDDLTTLEGLESVATVGTGVYIFRNNAITSFAGLNGLNSIGGKLHIFRNDNLTTLSGMGPVSSIGAELRIRDNASLANLNGLESLNSVASYLAVFNNDALINVDGLSGVTSIGGFLSIRDNESLTSIDGLVNIAPGSIARLYITHNASLANCDIDNVCTYLETEDNLAAIAQNAGKCNSPDAVNEACNANDGIVAILDGTQAIHSVDVDTRVEANSTGIGIKLYPNPTSGMLQIRNVEAQSVLIFNPQGQRVASYNAPGSELDLSTLPAGVYYLNFLTAEGSQTMRVVKVD